MVSEHNRGLRFRNADASFAALFLETLSMTSSFVRLACVLAVSICLNSRSTAEPYKPKVGKHHIDFALPNVAMTAAKPELISASRGKKTLFIQFASW